MFAYQYEYKGRQTAASDPKARQIIVLPTSADFAEGMDRLSQGVYNYDQYSRVEEFTSQARIFPAGQFVALDITDGGQHQVVGYTSSMRIQFDPTQPLLKPWAETTGYG
jgi:hypothetical protein